MTIKLELDQNEQNTLIQLLDVATKSAGLNVAEVALYFVKKIKAEQEKIEDVKTDTE